MKLQLILLACICFSVYAQAIHTVDGKEQKSEAYAKTEAVLKYKHSRLEYIKSQWWYKYDKVVREAVALGEQLKEVPSELFEFLVVFEETYGKNNGSMWNAGRFGSILNCYRDVPEFIYLQNTFKQSGMEISKNDIRWNMTNG